MTLTAPAETTPAEGFVTEGGVEVYRIPDFDRMPPFLMSLIGDSDLWMFVSSLGGLTAGRIDPDHSLFPYETDDKLHRAHPFTGPATLVRFTDQDGKTVLWEPFRNHGARPHVTRTLTKSVAGTRITYEEVHHDHGLTFRYTWAGCDEFGFVRRCCLINHGRDAALSIELLDGLLNLLPAGLPQAVVQQFSCLTNAYTRVEVDPQTRLTVLAMSSLLVDKAEPAEALKANVAWCRGLPGGRVIVDDDAAEAFRNQQPLPTGAEMTGRRAAYLIHTTLELEPGVEQRWDTIADAALSQTQAAAVNDRITREADLNAALDQALDRAEANLVANVASADGLQHTADRPATAHHFANVLFNNMRGGIFIDGYRLPADDFAAFVKIRNRKVAERHADALAARQGETTYQALLADAQASGDADLQRLTREYLPLTFSRRHGDPSRPWNHFAIHLKNPDGSRVLSYQGNWRDIFQNWESMCVSFPRYFESIIAKFVNASTADGFNPYRVTRDGIEWEEPEPDNPWASIGYWGDHQIVYLLKLLEHSAAFQPGVLDTMLDTPAFTYADVPYRIADYDAICRDPHNTIEFDLAHQRRVNKRVDRLGSDGKLMHDADDHLVHVTLAEKLLVPALAKLSNLVPGGGIWMNTQRPEWNDANNALVGHGVSMVTLCYLRRYAEFMIDLFGRGEEAVPVSAAVRHWFHGVCDTLETHVNLLESPTVSDTDRRSVLDALARVFCDYRKEVYANGVGAAAPLPRQRIVELFTVARQYCDHAIAASRRDDGLYHAYNLLTLDENDDAKTAAVGHLYKMLEGQVAVLSTGRLDGGQTAALVDALYESDLYRADQHSFMLYPNRRLNGFFERNDVPSEDVKADALLSAMLAAGDRQLIERDAAGRYRFHPGFQKAADLRDALDQAAADPRYAQLVAERCNAVLALYEKTFNHHAFTGRSGGMYGYEGLGSIYWHMVSKLLLAVQESYFRALDQGESPTVVKRLADAYYKIRDGIGFNKSAELYGAFPTDPYSHTPGHRGAQQPGMTGQVKEEVLTRLAELGVRVHDGRITFRPTLLRQREFTSAAQNWTTVDASGQPIEIELPAASVAFTYAQTPVVLHQGEAEANITLTHADGTTQTIPGDTLDAKNSAALFDRDGRITQLDVYLPTGTIRLD